MFTARRTAITCVAVLFLVGTHSVEAETLRVPQDHKTIQAAVSAASPGDTVLVSAGTYKERVKLAPRVTLKSAGDDAKGKLGFKRAEATIIDGGGEKGEGAGVDMGEGSTLDGITITNVGTYDDAKWNKHHATQGEEQSHEPIGKPGTAGIGVIGVTCTISNNIVHHIGYSGIAILGVKGKRCMPLVKGNVTYRNMGGGIGSMRGSTAVIQGNICFENFYAGIGHAHASPLVIDNICYDNVRAGIGISEGAKPVIRNNKCYGNRRAGIGIRTGSDTTPLVEHNECYDNDMAGIGNRDEATPIIRHNRCYKNAMAGIGSRDGARAVIEHNECFENGMAGIGSRLNAAPVIRHNRCYKNEMAGIGSREGARPIIEHNECFENKMAGIGSREGAESVIRNNKCYKNSMAGIGSRLASRPIIVNNECYENLMAGIGSREGARPVIRDNNTHHNKMAGIGSREGAQPVIVDNFSHDNSMAGIGVRTPGTMAIVVNNRCLENRLVAIGLPDGATAFLHGNTLKRTGGGAPPLVAVKGDSTAVFSNNSVTGGGVAGLLVQGRVLVVGNTFHGKGPGQGSALWVWKGSTLAVAHNRFDGYRNAVNASESKVTAADNLVSRFEKSAIIVRKPSAPYHVSNTTALADNPQFTAASLDDRKPAADDGNVVKPTSAAKDLPTTLGRFWPTVSETATPKPAEPRTESVEDGRWKLVAATKSGKTTYVLYDLKSDPQGTIDRSEHLEQIVFRLRGLLEKRSGKAYRAALKGGRPGR